MGEENKRSTVLVGAGAVLDFDLPIGTEKPSTEYITGQVIKVKDGAGNQIKEIEDVYNILKSSYPLKPNFEMLFHAIEMWCAYGNAWRDPSNKPKNPKMYPIFAPLVSPKWLMDTDKMYNAIHYILLKVMDIIDSYNEPFLHDKQSNGWYRDFWKGYSCRWDVFNLNYDTTIENSLANYEDGFEVMPNDSGVNDSGVKHFVPQKLWENKDGWSTVSHLHGCIEFFDYTGGDHDEALKYDSHDMYKYPSYKDVHQLFTSTRKSNKSNQAKEQLISTPIITGLRKNDKLNIVPFDFYHGHLFNCILKNKSLLLVGYSFGDTYINHVIKRMELLHGDSKRIVLIDWWGDLQAQDSEELAERMSYHVADQHFNGELGDFLCYMTGKTEVREAIGCFKSYDSTGPMISENGCLMLFIGGFKSATQFKDQIYNFLNS